MIATLLWFEVKNRLFRSSSCFHFLFLLATSFFLGILFAGVFKGMGFSLGFSAKLALNSPIVLHTMIGVMSYFGLLIIAPIFGQSISQDFESGFYQILFATPVRKWTYFLVRFIGSFLSSIAILCSIALGLFIATLMPFIDETVILENQAWHYILPYWTVVFPNIFVFGAIFLSVAAISKKMAPVYVASVSLFTGYMIAQNLAADLDNRSLVALVDPFGMEASYQIVRYWSVAEQNSQTVPLVGIFLTNRLFWAAIGTFVLSIAYFFFNPFSFPGNKKNNKFSVISHEKISNKQVDTTPRSWKVFWLLALSEFKQAFSNTYFLVILLCGILYIFVVSGEIGKIYGTETLPVTYHVLEVIGDTFSTFVIIILSYYAGELIWKDREQRIFELIDSKPVSDFFLCLSKFLSLIFIQLFLLLTILVSCVLVQIAKGYFHFEWGIYVVHLFLFIFPSWTLFSIFALFVHTISKNKQVGHTIFVSILLLFSWLPSFGLDHRLYLFGALPKPFYSDMNHFGAIFQPLTAYTLYWGFLHAFLFILTLLLWKRGEIVGWKDRLTELRLRIRPIHQFLMTTTFCMFISVGGYIYYNTNILNFYKTAKQFNQDRVDYEIAYKSFETLPHPKLVSVSLQLDLFPEKRSLEGSGVFKYRNGFEEPIQKILLNTPEDAQITDLKWDKSAILSEHKRSLGIRVYDFKNPIQPGEEVTLYFRVAVIPQGFSNSDFSRKIVENGTFFYSTDFFPTMGYSSNAELVDASSRKKFGLPEKLRMPNINDPLAIQRTYLSHEGDWIDFEATISTSLDQIAIASGSLKRQWEENGRGYFYYKTEAPILPFYAFLSGRYQVVRDQWNDVQIEIYHHLTHTQNLTRIVDSVKKSLAYYTENFSPYQFKELRIVEFPRYTTMAQSFPSTIPYSEGLGFIAKVDPNNPEDIDYPFYITAHEVAHQWWGHQVIGGKVQGATMLSESLAQYSALMVMEKEYGPRHMKKFLKYELDQYLHERGCEVEKELPLMLNENQSYIHYQKGSLVFYALKDYLGEKVINNILRDYVREVSFQKPPFTKSTDLVQRFKNATPIEMQNLVEDLFETITLYENRAGNAFLREKTNGKFEVEILSSNRKWRADEIGFEQEISMDDLVDIGIFDANGELKYLQKHRVQSGNNRFTIEVDFQPLKIGIDPLNKLIDKNSADKIISINPG